jgi:hypothetical protein
VYTKSVNNLRDCGPWDRPAVTKPPRFGYFASLEKSANLPSVDAEKGSQFSRRVEAVDHAKNLRW